MNMPRPEFVRGAQPGTLFKDQWYERYGSTIVLFEANRAYDHSNLCHQLQEWRTREGLPPTLGYSHRVEFSDAPRVELLAWTLYLDFHSKNPDRVGHLGKPPERLLYFANRSDLLRWIRQHVPHARDPRCLTGMAYTVHSTLFGPDEEVFPGFLLSI